MWYCKLHSKYTNSFLLYFACLISPVVCILDDMACFSYAVFAFKTLFWQQRFTSVISIHACRCNMDAEYVNGHLIALDRRLLGWDPRRFDVDCMSIMSMTEYHFEIHLLCCPLCTWKQCNKFFTHVHVHDTLTTRRMRIDFLFKYALFVFVLYIFLHTSQLGGLSCHVHLLYEKELHKSLSWQVVYSFFEICNGYVPSVKLVSAQALLEYMYIYKAYI